METRNDQTQQQKITAYYTLPPLPYPEDALAPFMSAETLRYHYGKHHQHYVEELNKLIVDSDLKRLSLEQVLLQAEGRLFNNAAQTWNHTFFWRCLTPSYTELQECELLDAIKRNFGSLKGFKSEFSSKAEDIFGSGWAWLVKDDGDNIFIECRKDAENPLIDGLTPLLTCDVWEHAYYIDYRNSRKDFLANFWRIVNWDFVRSNYGEALH